MKSTLSLFQKSTQSINWQSITCGNIPHVVKWTKHGGWASMHPPGFHHFDHMWSPCGKLLSIVPVTAWGEPAVSYRWTGWGREITSWSGDFRRITDHFRGIYRRIYLKWIKHNWKMSTCNRLDLESLGSWPTMPKNFPGIGYVVMDRKGRGDVLLHLPGEGKNVDYYVEPMYFYFYTHYLWKWGLRP